VKDDLQRILVAMDGSRRADVALEVACLIGEKFDSKLDVLHVIPIAGSPFEDPPLNIRYYEANVLHSASILERAKQIVNAFKLRGSTSTIVRKSLRVPDTIVKIASAGEYDLIAMGSGWSSGTRGLTLGSVSSAVVENASCPILLVKNPIMGFSKILVDFDGSEESKRALALCQLLEVKFQLKLSMMGFASNRLDGASTLLTSNGAFKDSGSPEYFGWLSDSINALNPPTRKAEDGEDEKEQYELVALGRSKFQYMRRNIYGSSITGGANYANTNVIIVP
jgi:nucleotide-binding universal stress UspA family protein